MTNSNTNSPFGAISVEYAAKAAVQLEEFIMNSTQRLAEEVASAARRIDEDFTFPFHCSAQTEILRTLTTNIGLLSVSFSDIDTDDEGDTHIVYFIDDGYGDGWTEKIPAKVFDDETARDEFIEKVVREITNR